jgi:hypothetical protein
MMREARYPVAKASSSFLSKGNAKTATNTNPMLLIDQNREPLGLHPCSERPRPDSWMDSESASVWRPQ